MILLKEFYRIAAPGGPVSPFIGSELQKERGIVENESKTGDLFLEDMPLFPRKGRLLKKKILLKDFMKPLEVGQINV